MRYRALFALHADRLCALFAATPAEIGVFLGVEEQTIEHWRKRHPRFDRAIKRGLLEAEFEVRYSLYRLAKGYDEGGVHLPPNREAAIAFLQHYRPELWSAMQRAMPPAEGVH